MAESVELATILLTDLVGSTQLATSVGPVRADELRDEHFALIREAVESAGGREVKNTGDGLMVAFGSASAAVECAVLVQQLFERRYRTAEQRLHIRIGLGAGEATVQDGDYFGLPSIEAARLCDKARSDGILVSSLVKALAGRLEGVMFESVGELELKGFGEPVEAFAVPWVPLGDEAERPGAWPLPALLRSVPKLAYVGRDAERGLLEGARSAARDGGRRVVLIAGEPGIGKTRLAAYAAYGAHVDGFAVSWGASNEEIAAPYEPWIEVCSHLVDHAPAGLLAAHVTRYGGEISRLARNLAHRVPNVPPPQPSDPETERYLLFAAVSGLLSDVSGSVPVLVVLDDFHWADGQSVALLKHVARTTEQSAVVVLVTYRDSDLGREHPLSGVLADLRQLEGVERIALQGLGAPEVAEMLAVAAGHELDKDGFALAGEVATETDGNPFFVGEVLRSLLESGRLLYDEDSGRWTVDRSTALGLPEGVREVVERRVERLGAQTRELLTLAAVIGRSFELELLTRAAEVGESELLGQLEAAVAASLLDESTEEVGRFRFVHALINQTLYEGLGASRRARTHHRIAEALEELYGGDPAERLGELALHWRLATTAVHRPKAADYAYRAGRRALESLAPAEAARLFGDAVELLGAGDTAERCGALIGLGDAQGLIGDPGYRETLLEASRIASALEDGELAARATLAGKRGRQTIIGQADLERLAAIERALELDDRSDPGRRGRLLALQAMELAYDPTQLERRRRLIEEAVSLSRDADDPAALGAVVRDTSGAVWAPDTLIQRAEMADELVRAANQAQDPALQWWAAHLDAVASMQLGRFDRTAAAIKRERQLADELGQPTLQWGACCLAACWELMHGHLVDGERLAERALALGRETEPVNSTLFYSAQLSYVRVIQGRGEEVIATMEQGVAAYPGIPAWRAALANAYCNLGAVDAATAILREAAADGFEHVPSDPIRLTALSLYASAAAQSGCVEAAGILYELLAPWADQVIATDPVCYGHVRLYLGLSADVTRRDDLAEEHLEFACRFHDEHALLPLSAYSHVGYARALAGRGDPTRAREHAQRALELARINGYGLYEARAAALLAASPTRA